MPATEIFSIKTRNFRKGSMASRQTQIRRNIKVPTPLGGQLSRRVQAGEISRDRAEQTAKERQTLKAAFGPNWRGQIGANLQGLRTGLTGAEAANPQYQAAYTTAMEARSGALERAKRKLAVRRKTKARRAPNVPRPR